MNQTASNSSVLLGSGQRDTSGSRISEFVLFTALGLGLSGTEVAHRPEITVDDFLFQSPTIPHMIDPEITRDRLIDVRWLPGFQSQLTQLGKLREGWDGYAAPIPNPWARFWAGRTLEWLDTLDFGPYAVTASVEGGVSIAFSQTAGRYADIEFQNDGEVSVVLDDPSAPEPLVMEVVATDEDVKRALEDINGFINHNDPARNAYQWQAA